MIDARRLILPSIFGVRETARAAFHDEAANHAVEFGPHHREIGDRRVRDPHLGAVQHVAVADALRARDHAARIGTVIGLGQTEAPNPLAGRKFRQIFLALRLSAVFVDRMHHQRRLHAHRRSITRIDAFDFARHQTVADVVDLGAAVLRGQRRSEHSERAEFVHDLAIETLLAVGADDARHQFVLRVVARRVAHHPFIGGELLFEQERIVPDKSGAVFTHVISSFWRVALRAEG